MTAPLSAAQSRPASARRRRYGGGAPAHIEARGIAVDFDAGRTPPARAARRSISSVPKGSFVSLIGPSGCGKSTLLKVLAGLIVPTEGAVSVAGIAPQEAAKTRLIGLVFQDATLLPWKNALENAAFLLMTADDTITQRRRLCACGRDAQAGRPGRRRAQASVAALRRHAPAGRDRARARARSARCC